MAYNFRFLSLHHSLSSRCTHRCCIQLLPQLSIQNISHFVYNLLQLHVATWQYIVISTHHSSSVAVNKQSKRLPSSTAAATLPPPCHTVATQRPQATQIRGNWLVLISRIGVVASQLPALVLVDSAGGSAFSLFFLCIFVAYIYICIYVYCCCISHNHKFSTSFACNSIKPCRIPNTLSHTLQPISITPPPLHPPKLRRFACLIGAQPRWMYTVSPIVGVNCTGCSPAPAAQSCCSCA